MRFRCFLWPNNLTNHSTCQCGKPLLFTHLLNCKHFITFRSKVHNNVRDQISVMCKSYRVDSFLDAVSIDPCNSTNEHLINSDANNPLLAGEKCKIAKYAKPISSVNENSHVKYNSCPFVFSLLGFLGSQR
ncbi:hypothetical protein P9112_001915 [Eukaryota sp. TZLM1-RC]